MTTDSIRQAADALRGARRVVALTGAGISAESGVPTFRGPEGLWRTFRAEQLATPEAFSRDPKLVWEWYDWRRERIATVRPNAGHRVLAAWEARFPVFTLVTQNVDGLHPLAGSRHLLELHGNIWQTRCTSDGTIRDNREVPLAELPPRCPSCGALVRPHIVWFGESLDRDTLQAAHAACGAADVVLVVGTSGLVYPAAGLPRVAADAGATVIEINPDVTPLTADAAISIRGNAGAVLPLVDAALR